MTPPVRSEVRRAALLAALLAWSGPVVAAGRPSAPGPPPPAVAPPARAVADDPDSYELEKGLRRDLEHALHDRDPAARTEAVQTYSASTRELPEDYGQAKIVARTLAGVLDDDDLGVRASAVAALSWGREVDTTVDAMGELIEELRNEVEKTISRPDPASRQHLRDAATLYRQAAQALARYADDRSVDRLAAQIRTLQPTGVNDNVGFLLAGPLAEALLRLGSREAVEAVLKAVTVYSGAAIRPVTGNRPTAERLHEALSDFAAIQGVPGPPFDEFYDQGWRDWFKAIEDRLPRRLGKLKEPPPPPSWTADDVGRTRPERR